MFAGNRISQDLIRFRGTVVPRAEFASQELHVGINDSAFRSVFPVFFPLGDELDCRSCQAPLAPVLCFTLSLCWLKFLHLFVKSDSFSEHLRKYKDKLSLNSSPFIIYNLSLLFRKKNDSFFQNNKFIFYCARLLFLFFCFILSYFSYALVRPKSHLQEKASRQKMKAMREDERNTGTCR